MTTQAQIDANRLNSLKSSGPRTDQGKSISRRNALKHGLAGQGIVLPDEDAAAFDQRRAEWNSSLRPFDVLDVWVADEVVRASLQIDRCHVQEQVLRIRLAERASNDDHWDDDRRLAAEALGRDLPRNPTMVIRQLRKTPQGADWIIERWEGLALILNQKGDWTAKQRRLALDLLGTPLELRDGPTKLDPKSGDPKAHRQAIIESELARLRTMKETRLAEDDRDDRDAAEIGIELEAPHALALLRRYESSCHRRFQWGLNRLKKGASSGPDPRPIPAYRPPTVAPAPPPPPPAPPVPAPSSRPASEVGFLDAWVTVPPEMTARLAAVDRLVERDTRLRTEAEARGISARLLSPTPMVPGRRRS